MGEAARASLPCTGNDADPTPVAEALAVAEGLSSEARAVVEAEMPAVLRSMELAAGDAVGRRHVVVTLGEDGVLWLAAALADGAWAVDARLLAASPVGGAHVSVTGCGDSLVGATVAGLAAGKGAAESLAQGLRAAARTLQSDCAVAPDVGDL